MKLVDILSVQFDKNFKQFIKNSKPKCQNKKLQEMQNHWLPHIRMPVYHKHKCPPF